MFRPGLSRTTNQVQRFRLPQRELLIRSVATCIAARTCSRVRLSLSSMRRISRRSRIQGKRRTEDKTCCSDSQNFVVRLGGQSLSMAEPGRWGFRPGRPTKTVDKDEDRNIGTKMPSGRPCGCLQFGQAFLNFLWRRVGKVQADGVMAGAIEIKLVAGHEGDSAGQRVRE
jgi:hypothetical protein